MNQVTLQTKIHYYCFDISNEDERIAYSSLKAELKHTPGRGHWHNARSVYDSHKHGDTEAVELETKCLFGNQWNTADNRLFDWCERYVDNRTIKTGHYLDITDEMREVRRNTHKCGYCGNFEPAAKGHVFCPECIGSEYLKEQELHLLRMRPVDTPFKDERPLLTKAEAEHLTPLYVEAQIHGNTSRDKQRIRGQREKLQRDHDHAIESAETEFTAFTWLMDRGIKTGNCIFYKHTGRFSFGWRKELHGAELSALQDVLCEFPFDYDLKTTGKEKAV